MISQFFCYLNSSKNITCPSGKLKTELSSPIAKSTGPGLSDTTFFARSTFFAHWLQEVVTYMTIVPKGVFSKKGPEPSTFCQRTYYLQFLSYVYVQFHVVPEPSLYTYVSAWCSTYNEQRPHHPKPMYQTVAYKRLKTVENFKIVRPKSGCRHS